jgi:hypothetical protein
MVIIWTRQPSKMKAVTSIRDVASSNLAKTRIALSVLLVSFSTVRKISDSQNPYHINENAYRNGQLS